MIERIIELISQGSSINSACRIVAEETNKKYGTVRMYYMRHRNVTSNIQNVTSNKVVTSEVVTNVTSNNVTSNKCNQGGNIPIVTSVTSYIREKRPCYPIHPTYSDLLSTMYI
jgi:hypothetical protein